jgi:hypothetical protein
MPSARASRTRILFDWLNRVLSDVELSPNAFKVAFKIGQHFNSRQGGAAWPSSLTIATGIGIDQATVIRAVRQLRERGHLIVEPGRPGRGHSNRYRMSKGTKDKAPAKPAPTQVLRTSRKPALVSLKPAPAHMNHLEPSMEDAKASSKRERERSHALADTPGAPAPYGGARKKFDALISIWRRPYGDEDEATAWRGFVAQCRAGDPDQIADAILASGHRWVAAYQHKPDMLKPLWNWLTVGAWKNLPPQKQRRGNAGRVSLFNIAIESTREGGD